MFHRHYHNNGRRIASSILVLLLGAAVMSSSGVAAASAASKTATAESSILEHGALSSPLTTKIVFSDVDGTLVHYPEVVPVDDNNILALPPSSTGMRAVISKETIRKCREIRAPPQGGGKRRKLVLVSGMRTTTLLNRLPYLPRADAYCSEGGGRIFYPTTGDLSRVRIQPLPFDKATDEDLQPFGLEEDLEWRKIMEQAAGSDGFVGQDVATFAKTSSSIKQKALLIDPLQRQGPIWDHARALQKRGLVLDTKGYATSFRVTENQQTSDMARQVFRAVLDNQIPCPPQVASRTNLGSIDFFPIDSGKKNW